MSIKWDQRFIELAEVVSTWSKDPKKQVGAVIVDKFNRIVSTGYNGLPRGIPDTPELLLNQELKLPAIIHAEVNAILFAKADLTDCTLYTTLPTCTPCSSLIIQSGIKRVVCKKYNNPSSKWCESFEQAKINYAQVRIELTIV